MSAISDLPEGFADLSAFIAWALPTEAGRTARRRNSTMDELRAFYDAMMPRIDAVLVHLNGFPLESMPAQETSLMRLALSFAEVAPYIEQYFRASIPETFDEARFIIGHEQPAGRRA